MNLQEFKNRFFKKAQGVEFQLDPRDQYYSVYFDTPEGSRISARTYFSYGDCKYLTLYYQDSEGNVTFFHSYIDDEKILKQWLKIVSDSGVLND